jgi:hypothetical protein
MLRKERMWLINRRSFLDTYCKLFDTAETSPLGHSYQFSAPFTKLQRRHPTVADTFCPAPCLHQKWIWRKDLSRSFEQTDAAYSCLIHCGPEQHIFCLTTSIATPTQRTRSIHRSKYSANTPILGLSDIPPSAAVKKVQLQDVGRRTGLRHAKCRHCTYFFTNPPYRLEYTDLRLGSRPQQGRRRDHE